MFVSVYVVPSPLGPSLALAMGDVQMIKTFFRGGYNDDDDFMKMTMTKNNENYNTNNNYICNRKEKIYFKDLSLNRPQKVWI